MAVCQAKKLISELLDASQRHWSRSLFVSAGDRLDVKVAGTDSGMGERLAKTPTGPPAEGPIFQGSKYFLMPLKK